MKKKMTEAGIKRSWKRMQERHADEVAESIARYCIGHSIEEVAEHFEKPVQWVEEQLDRHGMNEGKR